MLLKLTDPEPAASPPPLRWPEDAPRAAGARDARPSGPFARLLESIFQFSGSSAFVEYTAAKAFLDR